MFTDLQGTRQTQRQDRQITTLYHKGVQLYNLLAMFTDSQRISFLWIIICTIKLQLHWIIYNQYALLVIILWVIIQWLSVVRQYHIFATCIMRVNDDVFFFFHFVCVCIIACGIKIHPTWVLIVTTVIFYLPSFLQLHTPCTHADKLHSATCIYIQCFSKTFNWQIRIITYLCIS